VEAKNLGRLANPGLALTVKQAHRLGQLGSL